LAFRREQTGLYSHFSEVIVVYDQNLLMGLQRAEYKLYIALGDGVIFTLDYKMFQGATPIKDTYIIHASA
jgi:hypothetical protein